MNFNEFDKQIEFPAYRDLLTGLKKGNRILLSQIRLDILVRI